MVCLPQWEKYTKPVREKPLTDVNLAIVRRTILAPTSLIPARAGKELLKVVPSRYLPFFFKVSLCFFFLKKVGNVLSVFIQKVQWIESKRNWEKPLINTAWPLTSQTRSYQQDLVTTPETSLTCLRVGHRKQKWEKTLIDTGSSLNSQKCVYQRALQTGPKERPRPLKAKLGHIIFLIIVLLYICIYKACLAKDPRTTSTTESETGKIPYKH